MNVVIFLVYVIYVTSKKFPDFRECRKEESIFVLHIISWQLFFRDPILEVTLKLSKTAEICCFGWDRLQIHERQWYF